MDLLVRNVCVLLCFVFNYLSWVVKVLIKQNKRYSLV